MKINPEKIKDLEILFETDSWLAINKPAGISVHPDGKREENTISNVLLKKFPFLKDVGEDIELDNGEKIHKPGIVHRLDKETSGVLLVAKNQITYGWFKKMFAERKIKKTYNAFVYGKVKEDTGRIDKEIGRSKITPTKRATGKMIRGEAREAVTWYRVDGRRNDTTYLTLVPKTGRTHQIRIHMSSMGHPVVMDQLYAKKVVPILGFKRLALHARSVEFKDKAGKDHKIEAPFPEDFILAKSEFAC